MQPLNLECSEDARHRSDAEALSTVCPHDGAPLLVRYAVARLERAALAARPWTMWRYREMLPVGEGDEPVTLGEGATPLLPLGHVAKALGLDAVYVKDEAQNPTGSFKARGMSVAVTVAKRLGATALVAPSAGNAGGALAAYGARAALPVRVYVPRDTPALLVDEMEGYGAEVILVGGLIDDAGRIAAEYARGSGAFNVATFREPYRVEGKKTMGYELVEQLGDVPGTIIYPTGGGTGLVAMWKAFEELERIGWIGAARPVMISVQAEGCAPIVRAFQRGEQSAQRVDDGSTKMWGLRVPGGIGDRLSLRAIRESRGRAVTVTDAEAAEAMRDMHRHEGIDATEEGGATLAALRAFVKEGVPLPTPIVLFNTATSLKYWPR
ncbi:MAG TPA: threonine synthase [Candidatus Acidoferrales bacterium]|nr:threonine synthase [Candidatus Acidoferrales bacterium]